VGTDWRITLLFEGATCKDITYFKNVPIPFEAIRRGVSSLVRQLIIHDPESIDATYIHPETGVSLLNLAIVKELDIVVLNMLIEGNRVHLNAQDQRGNTALHTACVMRRPDIVEKLLNNGANPNVANASNVVYVAIKPC
jgi:ankyrin repeat protein